MIPVTMLSEYEFCSRKLFLEKVLKLVVPPKEVMVKGSVRHKVYDLINKKEKDLIISITKRLSYTQILELYKNAYADIVRNTISNNKKALIEVNVSLIDFFKQMWPLIVRECKSRAENLLSFIAKNEIYGRELWEKLTPKIESEFKIESEELKLTGVIDKVEIYPDSVIPFEIKTGKAPDIGVWSGHKLQLAAYVMMLEEAEKNVDTCFVTYLDINESREIAINPFLREKVLKIRDEVIKSLEEKELPDFCDNKNKCNACSLKEQCYNQTFMKKKMSNLNQK